MSEFVSPCDVCEDEEMVGVASMPGVPISFAYGRRCLDADAHPYWAVVANTAMCGGYDQTAPWWQEMVDSTLAHLNKSREQFDIDVAKNVEEIDAFMYHETSTTKEKT